MPSRSPTSATLTPEHRDDLKRAASKMLGDRRRAFQAEMTVKYCGGNARQAETVFGWNRQTVEVGLNEQRTGIVCLGAERAFSGDKCLEEKHPQTAEVLWVLVQEHAQQDPTFRATLAFTRLTAAKAIKQMRARGVAEEQLPSPSIMAEGLKRNGYRLRPVLKAKSQKKLPQTDAIFSNIRAKEQANLTMASCA